MPVAPPTSNTSPVLVTGVPRSGTTWLARWLAMGHDMALAGREPMNPRGRQYALAGTLEGWARLTSVDRRQQLALVAAYRGWNPFVYSRYGMRQWAAVLPRTRMVVKDPFAMLSVPLITSLTGVTPVVVYRHPGAVLSSYRRMGWEPDLHELQRVVVEARADGRDDLDDLPGPGQASPAEAMGHFWARLHELCLGDLEASGTRAVVVAHHEIATAGAEGGRRFADRVGVRWSPAMEQELSRESGSGGSDSALHNLQRSPAEVAEAWRRSLDGDEVEVLDRVTGEVQERLAATRFRFDVGD